MYDVKDWLEIGNHLVVIGGVLWAAFQWPKARDEREAADRQKSYAALNDHFLKFLELQHVAPGLSTSATDRTRVWEALSPSEQARQVVQLEYLSSILERAYDFLVKSPDAKTDWHIQEWKTWEHWIDRYAQNPNFVAFWGRLDETGDSASYSHDFVSYIKDKIQNAKKTLA